MALAVTLAAGEAMAQPATGEATAEGPAAASPDVAPTPAPEQPASVATPQAAPAPAQAQPIADPKPEEPSGPDETTETTEPVDTDADADANAETGADAESDAEADTEPVDPASKRPLRPPGYADGFHFGSYGRVIAGGDATGRAPRSADIVARGSRMDESTYAELELRREDYWDKVDAYTRIVSTVAFAHPVFHYNADFNAKLAIRNLYLEERDLGLKGLSVWAGARMYRGDDVYLLDYWPLDNLNTIGGGLGYTFKSQTSFRLHAGLNQPTDPFFRQTILRSPVHNQLGQVEVDILDRQKLVSSARVSHLLDIGEYGGIKFVGYGEFHWTGAGQREIDDRVYEDLPADNGFVAGGEVSVFSGKRSGHLNVYGRYARGLAAYGEWGAPTQLAPDLTADGAQEWVVAIGGNYEAGPFGVLLGAYLRSFRNASAQLDFDDLTEGIVIARPQVWLGKKRWFGLALEGSYQAQQRGVSIETEEGSGVFEPLFASVGRVGFMPFLSPGGAGSYSRPHIRLMYLLTVRDNGARSLYAEDDVFARRQLDHFIGVGVEWWFGSTSYFRN